MKKQTSATTTLGTTGSLTARVDNPQVVPPQHDHVGDPDRMLMLIVGGEFRFHSTERLGPGPNQLIGVDVYVPESLIPADGVERVLSIPSQARATWWAHENAGSQPYPGISGELKITLTANERATGTFYFVGQAGTNKQVHVTSGALNLQDFTTPATVRQSAAVAGSGNFNGVFVGGPAVSPFAASQVSIQRHAPVGIPPYFDVQGRLVEGFPERTTFISIMVDEGATGQTFDLATSTEARVSFFDFPLHGFAYAIKGTLTFTSKPDTGQAAGTLRCTFQKNDEPTFTFDGTFDVTA